MKSNDKKRSLSDFTPKELKEMPLQESADLFGEAIVQNLKQVNEMKTIKNVPVMPVEEYELLYNYQPELTSYLNELDTDFDQDMINQIVLWKINRYAKIDNSTLQLINKIKKTDRVLNIELTGEILLKLLCKEQKGIRLPLASTILRFRNRHIYPIIDQRAYRFVYGKELKYSLTDLNKQIMIYLDYISDVKKICEELGIEFYHADSFLYTMDRNYNSEFKLKGY